jgi:hypothetical protein
VLLLAFYAFAIWTAWPPHDMGLARVHGKSHIFGIAVIVSLVWGICQPWFLSIPFWIAIALWFNTRRMLVYLLPVFLFALFSGLVYCNFWHAGLLVPLLICVLWIAWNAPARGALRYEAIGRFALVVLIGTQILWSGYALAYDHYNAFSPDRDAAEYLKQFVREGVPIAVTYVDDMSNDKSNHAFDGVGLQPYFDRNIFVNQPYSFWWWSDQDPTELRFNALLPSHPRIVLVEIAYTHPDAAKSFALPKYRSLEHAGYRLVKAFCGAFPERLEPGLTNCHMIFQYAGGQTDASQPRPKRAGALDPRPAAISSGKAATSVNR